MGQPEPVPDREFTDEQKHYLQGFCSGVEARRSRQGLPTFAETLGVDPKAGPPQAADGPWRGREGDDLHRRAQDRFLAAGKKLAPEEEAKRRKDPLAMWDELRAHAEEDRFPQGLDVFLFKFQGLFYVAPAQDAFMCRLRLPGGILTSHQLRGVASIAERFGGGYADVTTRANLQIREIRARHL